MREYFIVTIAQEIEHVKRLLKTIDDSSIPQEYRVLAKNCRNELIKLKNRLQELKAQTDLHTPETQSILLRLFRRVKGDITKLEITGIFALARRHPDDIFLTRLVDMICQEIKYPFLPPVVSTLSLNYFSIHNKYEVMFVPLNEGNYLLHLPDLYHELAHPLLFDEHNTQVAALRRAADRGWAHAIEYLHSECENEKRLPRPQTQEYLFYFYLWEQSWRDWIIEFCCDLFAVCTLGPAFVWSHIHLCMKMHSEPFYTPTTSISSHPADHARMLVMLKGLKALGYDGAIKPIEEKWNEYLDIANAKPTANYKRCFPDELLGKIADIAYVGMQATPCRLAKPDVMDPIHNIFNSAWTQFWDTPDNYITWENEQVSKLREICKISQ